MEKRGKNCKCLTITQRIYGLNIKAVQVDSECVRVCVFWASRVYFTISSQARRNDYFYTDRATCFQITGGGSKSMGGVGTLGLICEGDLWETRRSRKTQLTKSDRNTGKKQRAEKKADTGNWWPCVCAHVFLHLDTTNTSQVSPR